MEKIHIAAQEDTPEIVIDPAANRLAISGRSLPEDVALFYQPVLEWLNNSASGALSIEVKLEYFNTASSKILLDIFMLAEDKLPDARILWHYDQDDDDMKEAGEEYQELVTISFELVGY
ncbi:MAG: DUF1987 domain-containing protein [Bacteroidia bacterium]|jgi:hypothetical protein|nr:DUF1987 domain-containing protein [Bacteroidia bacterium]